MKKKKLLLSVLTLLILFSIPVEGMLNNTIKNENIKMKDLYYQEFVPGEFIVKFTNDTEPPTPAIEEYNRKYKVYSFKKVYINSENTILDKIFILKVPKDSNIHSIVKDYESLSEVVYAEPNYILCLGLEPRSLPISIPTSIYESRSLINTNDPYFDRQWALENTGQRGGNPEADIDALEAWGIETGESDTVIAIIDTGVDYNHPDLVDNIWINKNEIPINGIDDDGNGFVDDVRGWDFVNNDNVPIDDFGHGTHCAGIVAAVGNNSIGIAGVCWNCKIMPIKTLNFLGQAMFLNIGLAIRYAADTGANVISMSFGGRRSSKLIRDAIDYAYNKDVVLTAAAGNSNTFSHHYPAAYDGVIAVAGTNNKDRWLNVGNFFNKVGSNYGPWVDVAAPGGEIYSTMPTYLVTMNLGGYKKNYDYLSGTSMSAPHVAGLAALILSKKPFLSNDEVKSIISTNVDPYYSIYYLGTGRINAFKALNEHILSPEIPDAPLGPINGKIGEIYTYTTKTTDQNLNQLYYMWDWGEENSNWIGPFDSGEQIFSNHTWIEGGTFKIKVKAKNKDGAESLWSKKLTVTIPRNKEIENLFFFGLLERFQILKIILTRIINL